jgi:pilus assembly protein CpaB
MDKAMLLRVILFSMLTLGIVGGGAVAWIVLAPPAAAPAAAEAAAPAVKIPMIVASRSLRAGSLIKPEDLAAKEIAKDDMPNGASLDTPPLRGSLTGAMIRHSLAEGQPILPADVMHPGDHGFLAAVLGPNMRAITVAVDVVSGTAGLIWPGDRVDLILTQALSDPALTAGRKVAAETVLSGARVIAIDQQIVQGQAPDGSVTPANRTATLEVTSAQAERVLVAGHLGNLSLSVLSADRGAESAAVAAEATDTAPQAAEVVAKPRVATAITSAQGATQGAATQGDAGRPRVGVTWAGDVSPALSGDAPKTPVMVHVFQGGADGKEFHF